MNESSPLQMQHNVELFPNIFINVFTVEAHNSPAEDECSKEPGVGW